MPGVAILVDLANIHLGLKYYYLNPPPYDRLAQIINDYGANLGDIRVRKVYTDWNDSRLEWIARQFSSAGFRAEQVTRKASGKDRTDICLSLDALELFNDEPELDTLVLAAGDADYVEIMQRLRQKGKRLFVITLEKNFAPELLPHLTGNTILEKELASLGLSLIPYEPYLQLLYGLQQFHHSKPNGFVAVKLYMRKMEELGLTQLISAVIVLSKLLESKVVTTYQVSNPQNPDWPTSAIQLNWENEVVKNYCRNRSLNFLEQEKSL